MFNILPEINREYILNRITEEDIFHKYMGIYPNTEDYFANPLRNDDHADCKFYRDSTINKSLKFKDFAWGINWDCFNVVQYVIADVNNYYDALRKVAEDFNLLGSEINLDVVNGFEDKIRLTRRNTGIRVARRDWYDFDIKWWKENCTDNKRALDFFNVAPVEAAWSGDRQIYYYDKKDPCYVFWFGDYDYKLYFPLRKQGRFLNNRTNLLQGWNQLPAEGENLIITKSYKDVICMRTFGYYAVAPMSESVLVTEEQFEELNNRFFNIYSLMDRDRAGMRMAQILRKKYNIQPLLFPTDNNLFRSKNEPKDFTDNVFADGYGVNYINELVEELKKWIGE